MINRFMGKFIDVVFAVTIGCLSATAVGLTALAVGLVVATLFSLFSSECEASEKIEATVFLDLGAYHRSGMSDPLITTNYYMGSDTPGTIDIGVEFNKCGWFFGADNCAILWHHQSYVDRGDPFNGDPEAQLDMFGMKWRWELMKISF